VFAHTDAGGERLERHRWASSELATEDDQLLAELSVTVLERLS
jgi:hypothetical protein